MLRLAGALAVSMISLSSNIAHAKDECTALDQKELTQAIEARVLRAKLYDTSQKGERPYRLTFDSAPTYQANLPVWNVPFDIHNDNGKIRKLRAIVSCNLSMEFSVRDTLG